MFPFPPAPVLRVPNKKAKIINISNVSSDSSTASDAAVDKSPDLTSPVSSPGPGAEAGENPKLNDAMVIPEDSSDLDESWKEVSEENSNRERTDLTDQSKSVASSLPLLLQQTMLLQTRSKSSEAYVPLAELPEVVDNSDKALIVDILQHFQCYDDERGLRLRNQIIEELNTLVRNTFLYTLSWICRRSLKVQSMISVTLGETMGEN